MTENQKVSIYDEASVEIINGVADTLRTGLLKDVGYMFEKIPFGGKAYDMRIEGLKEEFVVSIALIRDSATNTERRFYLKINAIPTPYFVNISSELAYGGIEKLYNYLSSDEAVSDVRLHLRDLLLRADDWRKDQD